MASIAAAWPSLAFREIEIAVDIRPRELSLAADLKLALLEDVVVNLFGRELHPQRAAMIKEEFRAYYRHTNAGGRVSPFNVRLPRANDQQLHGGRTDDAQVKVYLKRRDGGMALSSDDFVARVEVRLSGSALAHHGLFTLEDLLGFKFRKQLSTYFTHVSGVAPRRGSVESRADAVAAAADSRHFGRAGVGAFLPGGQREKSACRLVRDIPTNNRIGQALTRLEQRFASEKFVRCNGADKEVTRCPEKDFYQKQGGSMPNG